MVLCLCLILLCISALSAGALATEEYPTAGDMGSGSSWRLEGGTLYISGSGKMPSECGALWNTLAEEIGHIVVESGITSIPPMAF